MRHLRIAVAALVAVAIAACQFGVSSDASIVSFSLDGITVDASIDPDARTVVVSAPPVDLSKISASIAVSSGADLDSVPTFVDGVPTPVTVIAEDGTEITWTVTVNLQLGVSFKLDGEWVFLLAGFVNTENAEENEDLGNGEPGGSRTGSDLQVQVVRDVQDVSVSYSPEANCISMDIYGFAVGTFTTVSDGYGDFYLDYNSDDEFYYLSEGTIDVTHAASSVGDLIVATFAALLEYNDGQFSADLTNGFMKLRRIADDVWGFPA
ncbi:MAG: hypothetical protein EA382_18785 [Spirochaetaceae bacterium]|nr:MAG: hypothetical protein EA382_18785 [Spirochaetaceae bacterium]